jgi:hypothetical protein
VQKPTPPIVVDIRQSEDTVILHAGEDQVRIKSSHPARVCYPKRADFAAWLWLPVAMCAKRPLHIRGAGSAATRRNFALQTTIWTSWMPDHFSPVTVTFDQEAALESPPVGPPRDLCFYSGGVDSTYTILQRLRSGLTQDLLTVCGMDYALGDQTRFERFLNHTRAFAQQAAAARLIVTTDIYGVYDKYAVNRKHHHLTHIFALAGCGFLHAGAYRQLVIASDHRLDQQFLAHPWGNNAATNPFFDDGATRMVTDSDALTRTEKLPLLLTSAEALAALSFCVDVRFKPENCGLCAKCLRTKLMFLAVSGRIPPVFASNAIPRNWMRCFHYESPNQLAYLLDTINVARLNGRTDAIPYFAENEQRIAAYLASGHRLLSLYRIRDRCQKWSAKLQRYLRPPEDPPKEQRGVASHGNDPARSR